MIRQPNNWIKDFSDAADDRQVFRSHLDWANAFIVLI